MFIAILRDGQTESNAIKFPSPEVEAPKMIINSPPPTPRRPKILFPLPRHIFHVPLNPFLAALWALLKETQLDLIIIESNSRERTRRAGERHFNFLSICSGAQKWVSGQREMLVIASEKFVNERRRKAFRFSPVIEHETFSSSSMNKQEMFCILIAFWFRDA